MGFGHRELASHILYKGRHPKHSNGDILLQPTFPSNLLENLTYIFTVAKFAVRVRRYVLACIETLVGVCRGDRVWQLAFGSGFKVNSAVWRARKASHRQHAAFQPS